MKVPISKHSNIYVVAPANLVTGGPEDLHQLAYSIRELYPATKVFMYYVPPTAQQPIADVYAHFHLPFAREIEDSPHHVIIIPEVLTTHFPELKQIQKVLWWLSVDNYYSSRSFSNTQRWINAQLLRRLGSQRYLFFDKNLKKIKWHLVQARYGYDHIKKKGVENIFYLMDHVHPDFTTYSIDESVKENIVAYNPIKGYAFTKKIIASSPDIIFVPIQNMSREQVIELLRRAKVYIDFGNHPGGDRFPKETALMGCCVITGKRGSAKFFDDVPIPPDYKFSQTPWSTHFIRKKIKHCFENYHNEVRRFIPFRERAKKDHDTHLSDIQNLFSFDSAT